MKYFNVYVRTYLGRHVYTFVSAYVDARAHTQCKLKNQSSNLQKRITLRLQDGLNIQCSEYHTRIGSILHFTITCSKFCAERCPVC